MERLCQKELCQESAICFCLNCQRSLCGMHKDEDIREQQKNSDVEHYYTDALQYMCNNDKFAPMYCKEHPNQFLTRRCVNCFLFSCNLCHPKWCAKAGGRYHDNDMIDDLVGSYKDKVSELQMKLQKKHMRFLMNLKEACRKQDDLKSEMAGLINDIDRAVEVQKAAVTEEGERLKQEITYEMSQSLSQITEQIRSIEEKEGTSRQLLNDMQKIKHTTGSLMVIHNYPRLQEDVTDLLKWKIPNTESTKLLLCQGKKSKYLGLELAKTASTSMDMPEEDEDALEQPEEKKTELIPLKSHLTSDHDNHHGLCFLSEDKVLTWGLRESVELADNLIYGISIVLQLLPYGDQLLLLASSDRRCTVIFKDTYEALYEFIDRSGYHDDFSRKLMAVTCNHQLVVLQGDAQIIHLFHLETKAEMEIMLFVGKRVYGIISSLENKLILLCREKEWKEAEEKEAKHSVIMYDLERQKVVWVSDCFLTVTHKHDRKRIPTDRLNVAGYGDFLYVLSFKGPTKVFKVNLCDGRVVQEILFYGLPDEVWDISLRGSTLAAVGCEKISSSANYGRVCYFKVSDITAIM